MRAFVACFTGFLMFACIVAAGCSDRAASVDGCEIAVTNSYLQCAVRDVWGTEIAILCLAPPGMCPGHFDISPSQVRQLKGSKLLLRFDFQQGIEQRLERMRQGGLDIQPVDAPTGLCVPDSYLVVCRKVCQILSRTYPQQAAQFDARLAAIQERLAKLADELRQAVTGAGVASAGVLTSHHQAEFSRWLGLDPIASFVGSDAETVASIDHCLKMTAGREVRFVIANQQEGTALAQALAERLQARAVVFGSFPQKCEGQTGFDHLLRDNVDRLCEAVAK